VEEELRRQRFDPDKVRLAAMETTLARQSADLDTLRRRLATTEARTEALSAALGVAPKDTPANAG